MEVRSPYTPLHSPSHRGDARRSTREAPESLRQASPRSSISSMRVRASRAPDPNSAARAWVSEPTITAASMGPTHFIPSGRCSRGDTAHGNSWGRPNQGRPRAPRAFHSVRQPFLAYFPDTCGVGPSWPFCCRSRRVSRNQVRFNSSLILKRSFPRPCVSNSTTSPSMKLDRPR
jgi:hypothetical protein